MIKHPIDMTFTDKKFSMIIYGSPGLGKTTLALSAPKPLLFDFDQGISRVKAQHRQDTSVCDNYEDVITDLESPAINDYETIIIDTGGSFITYLQDWAMRTDPANRQKNGAISLKGFGAVKQEFERRTSYIRDVLKKNVIYVFHSDEQKDKDGNVTQRLQCEGAARNTVWKSCDFGGYMQMLGNNRTISFTPTSEFFAKGCHGIEGTFPVNELKASDKNDFVTRLFDRAKQSIIAENEAFAPQKTQYDKAMKEAAEIIDSITTVDEANDAVTAINSLPHALTSLSESKALLKARFKKLGFVYNKETKQYEVKNG